MIAQPDVLLPIFIVTALVGAVYIGYLFRRLGHFVPTGAALGATAGTLGPLLFMLPLNFCTFEPERTTPDVVFGVLLVTLGTGLLLFGTQWAARFVLIPESRPSLMGTQATTGTFHGFWTPMLLLLPTLVILALFLYYPAFETFRLSTLLARLGAPRTIFQCVNNFTELFNANGFDVVSLALVMGLGIVFLVSSALSDLSAVRRWTITLFFTTILLVLLSRIVADDYFLVLFNTFVIATAIVVIGLIMALAIAYLAYQPVRGASIYRTLLIWPYAISPPVAGIIFFVMFNPVAGIINHVIELTGGQAVNWFLDPWPARMTIIAASVWKTLGFNILFYIAGLQNVPTSHQEAAAIDGANAWQRFRHVTFPALSPITFFLIVTNVSFAFFDIFGTIDYLTKGAPAGGTSVMIYEIIQVGVRTRDLGRAAAQSIVLFILVIGITYLQFRTTGRRVSYGA